MARHQVFNTHSSVALLQFRTPFANATQKIQHRASLGLARPGDATSPRPPLPCRRQPLPRCCADTRVHARLILNLYNLTVHRNIHIHQHVLRHCPPPSESLCHSRTSTTPPWPTGTTPTPAWTKPSQCILTLPVNHTHRYALWSLSIDTMRFFLDLHADGRFHPHSLLCFPSHKEEQS